MKNTLRLFTVFALLFSFYAFPAKAKADEKLTYYIYADALLKDGKNRVSTEIFQITVDEYRGAERAQTAGRKLESRLREYLAGRAEVYATYSLSFASRTKAEDHLESRMAECRRDGGSAYTVRDLRFSFEE